MPYLSALEVCSRRGAIQIRVYLTLPKGASSTPPAPWPSDTEKRFQEFPEAQGRVYATNRNRQSVPDSWSSDAERPVTDCSSRPRNFQQGRAGRAVCSCETDSVSAIRVKKCDVLLTSLNAKQKLYIAKMCTLVSASVPSPI